MKRLGVVTIGRNEGDRLVRCLQSLRTLLPSEVPIVYVDSGSTDGSVAIAQSLGVQAIELDRSIPFTMARGRNTGFRYLSEHYPEIEYIQFLDGDCELLAGWLEKALSALEANPRLAVVCGRRRERFPEASIYNQLADMEWNTPVGEAKYCGGDALIRVQALQSVNGYNESLICGEEPEMCIRMRAEGWQIQRIAVEMTLHDAAITHFSQWWRRSIRGGWAVAEGAALHGGDPERYMIRESRSGWLWGIIVPLFALGLAGVTSGWSLLLLVGYLVLLWRIDRYRRQHGDLPSHARLYAFFCVLYKIPQAIGQSQYWLKQWRGQPATLIEYKTSQKKQATF
jgi:glycosyltransferase involved in cell wall biosynthesis